MRTIKRDRIEAKKGRVINEGISAEIFEWGNRKKNY